MTKPHTQVTINSTLKRKFVSQFKQILVQVGFQKSVNIAENWQGTQPSVVDAVSNHDPKHFFQMVFICPQCLLSLVTIN